jgi:hypothetical protein
MDRRAAHEAGLGWVASLAGRIDAAEQASMFEALAAASIASRSRTAPARRRRHRPSRRREPVSTQATEQMSEEDARAAVLATIARQQADARQAQQRDTLGRFRADPAKARSEALFEIGKRADKAAQQIRADFAKPPDARQFRDHRAQLARVEREARAAMRHAHQQALDVIAAEQAEIRATLFRAPADGSRLLEVAKVTGRAEAARIARAAAQMGDVRLLRALAILGSEHGWADAIYPVWASVDSRAKELMDRSDELDSTLAGMSTPAYRLGRLEDGVDRAAEDSSRAAEDAMAAEVRGDIPVPEITPVVDDTRERVARQVAASLARSGVGGDDFEEE